MSEVASSAGSTASDSAGSSSVAPPSAPVKKQSSVASTASSNAAATDEMESEESLAQLLVPPTPLSRPILLLQKYLLSTSSRRVRFTALDATRTVVIVAAATGTLYAYQKPYTNKSITGGQQDIISPHANTATPPPNASGAPSAPSPSPNSASSSLSLPPVRLSLLKLISRGKEQAILFCKFCPTHDDLLAIATAANEVILLDLKLGNLKEKEKLIWSMPGLPPLGAGGNTNTASSDSDEHNLGHRDRITSLVWDSSGTRIITGDRSGVVLCSKPFLQHTTPTHYLNSIASASAAAAFFAKKPTLKEVVSIVYKGDSEVVQIAVLDSLPTSAAPTSAAANYRSISLAISTLTRVVVLPLSRPQSVVPIGTKARNGPFGVCRNPLPDSSLSSNATAAAAAAGANDSNETAMVLASRPGKRVWQAETEKGQVLSTLKLKLPPMSRMQPFSTPSTLPLPAAASSIQFYSLQTFSYGLLSYYTGPVLLSSSEQSTQPPASPYLFFIDPHHVLIHEWVDIGGAVRHVASRGHDSKQSAFAANELWLLHDTPAEEEEAAAAEGNSVQLSAVFAYPADHFLAHLMRLSSSLFPATSSLHPSLFSTPQNLPPLPQSLAQLFPTQESPSTFVPTLESFVRLSIRHHIHDRSLLTMLRNAIDKQAESMQMNSNAEGESASSSAAVPLKSDEELMKAFEELIDEAERMERMSDSNEENANSTSSTSTVSVPLARQASAPSVPSSATAPISIPQPARANTGSNPILRSNSLTFAGTPTNSIASASSSPNNPSSVAPALSSSPAPTPTSTIEGLLSKVLRATSSNKDKDKEKDSNKDINNDSASISKRSESPEPSAYITASSSGPTHRTSHSLSSSPQTVPGQFLPGGGVPNTGMPPRVTRMGSNSGANPFISNLPPPQLPTPAATAAAQSKPVSVVVPTTPPIGISTTPSSSTSSSSSNSAVSFFKELLSMDKDKDKEKEKEKAKEKELAASAPAPNTTDVVSDDSSNLPLASLSSPSFAKAAFLPASGPFAAPIFSPMLAKSVSLTPTPQLNGENISSNDIVASANGGFDEAAFVPDVSAAMPIPMNTVHKKKGKSKRTSEIVQIARAPAKLLPTPFQADRPSSAFGEGGVAEEEEEQPMEELLSASPAVGGLVGKKLKKVKEGKKKKKASVIEPSSSPQIEISPPALRQDLDAALPQPMPLKENGAPVVLAPTPKLAASVNGIAVDGIDLNDLEDENDAEVSAAVASTPAPSVNDKEGVLQPPVQSQGAVAGEAHSDVESDIDEGDASDLSYALLTLPQEVVSTLTQVNEELVPTWTSTPALASFPPAFLLNVEAAFLVLDTIRRERFGRLGVEEACTDAHALMPSYAEIVTALVEQTSQNNNNKKPRSKRLAQSDLQTPLRTFLHDAVMQIEQTLLENSDAASLFSVKTRPSQFPAASVSALSARAAALAAALSDIAAPTVRAHIGSLLFLFLQLHVQDRVLIPVGVDSMWNAEDCSVFVSTYASLLNKKQVLALCNTYQLHELIEQVHALFENHEPKSPAASASSTGVGAAAAGANSAQATANWIDKLLKWSSPESSAQVFPLLKRSDDASLVHRFLTLCFHKIGSPNSASSNITTNINLSSPIELAVQHFPQIGIWSIARALDIKVSLWMTENPAERLLNWSSHVEKQSIDLSAAPEGLKWYPTFVEQTAAPQNYNLNKVHQQYHGYFHYLRMLLATHERARKNEDIVLEFIRISLCFSRKQKSELVRLKPSPPPKSAAANGKPSDVNDADPAVSYVPIRGSQQDSWVHEASMLSVLSSPTVYAINRQQLARLCVKYAFVRGVIALYTQELHSLESLSLPLETRLSLMRHVFEMALYADDRTSFVQAVDAFIVRASTPLEIRVELWRYILDEIYILMLSPIAASLVPIQLNLQFVLNLVIYSIGPQLTVSLLLNEANYVDLCDRASLPASFYNDILSLAVLRGEQACLNQELMQCVDAHLWSDRSKNMTESFRAIYNTEVSAALLSESASKQDLVKGCKSNPSRGGSRRGSQNARDNNGISLPTNNSSSSKPLDGHPLSAFIAFKGELNAEVEEKNSSRNHGRRGSLGGSSASSSSQSGSSNLAPALVRSKDYQLQFDYTASTDHASQSAFYEDLSNHNHFGILIDFDARCCDECSLPLIDRSLTNSGANSSTSQPTLCVFRCQHIFHDKCVPERACSICWENEFLRNQ